MHGRLKVKDKSEIEKEKRKQFEEKCKQFKVGLDKALLMKSKKIYTTDALKLTGQLVIANPDVSTLWNYRKEVLVHFKQQISSVEDIPVLASSKESDDEQANQDQNGDEKQADIQSKSEISTLDEFESILKDELELTLQSFLKNMKSYCVWQHRLWILELMQKPDYEKELLLCDAYLQKDGRNFHVWDYRRIMCQIIDRTVQEELSFSLKKIKEDISAFSYSTLYYRSSVFTRGALEGQINFTEHWQNEYEIVENGIFTEPNDQALWFYLRWLLATNFGKNLNVNIDTKTVASGNDKELQLIRVVLNREEKVLMLHFNVNVYDRPYEKIVLKMIDGDQVPLTESLVSSSNSPKLWFVSCQTSHQIAKILFNTGNLLTDVEVELENIQDKPISVWTSDRITEIECAIPNILPKQLENLLALKELDPENKWLHLVLSSLTGTDQFSLLETLKKLDPLRKNYYSDQQSKVVLKKFFQSTNLFHLNGICFRQMQLTLLPFAEPFSHLIQIDLTGNRLMKLSTNFNTLVCVRLLILDSNVIEKIEKGVHIPRLTTLYMQNNRLKDVNGLKNLDNCTQLKNVYLFGNELNQEIVSTLSSDVLKFHLQSQDAPKIRL